MPKMVCDGKINVRVPRSIEHRIQDCADALGISFAEYVRDILITGLSNRERYLVDNGIITQEHIDSRPYRAFKANGKDLRGRKNA